MTDVRDVGDWRSPTIAISTADVPPLPAAGTVTCAVEAPDGTISPVVMTAGTPTATATPWTGALYELTQAGEWIERFTVTGDGKGKARQLVWVTADPGVIPSGMRVYATTADYANDPRTSAPDSSISVRKALLVASQRVDEMATTALYETNSTTLQPTDSAVAAALRDATIAQAAYAIPIGDAYGLGTTQYRSVSIGGVTLSRGSTPVAGSSTPGRYAPEARETLRAAGLLGAAPLPYIWGGGAF